MEELSLVSDSTSAKVPSKGTNSRVTYHGPRKYKVIVAPTIDRLQVLVNAFLESEASDGFEALGSPQVFGHEEYTQAFMNNNQGFEFNHGY